VSAVLGSVLTAIPLYYSKRKLGRKLGRQIQRLQGEVGRGQHKEDGYLSREFDKNEEMRRREAAFKEERMNLMKLNDALYEELEAQSKYINALARSHIF
jgi:hypothetical protein